MLKDFYRIRKTEKTCKEAFLSSKWYMSIFEVGGECPWCVEAFDRDVTSEDYEETVDYNVGEVLVFNDIIIRNDSVHVSLLDKDLKSVGMKVSELFAYLEDDNSTVMFLNDTEKHPLNDFSFSEENRFKVGEIGTYFPW